MEIRAKGTLDLKTVTALNRASQGAKPYILIGVYVVLVGWFAYTIFSPRFSTDAADIMLFAICVIMSISMIALVIASGKRSYKMLGKQKDAVNELVFRDESFEASAKTEDYEGRTEADYGRIVKAIETKEYFFIFNTKRTAIPVDKSTISGGTAEELAEKLKNSISGKYTVRKH